MRVIFLERLGEKRILPTAFLINFTTSGAIKGCCGRWSGYSPLLSLILSRYIRHMTFWLISAVMAALVALVLGRALWRGGQSEVAEAAAFDVQVYRDQLAEVERDVTRGVVPPEDAERVRTEISRRILAADRAAQDNTVVQDGPQKGGIIAVVGLLVAGSLGLYAWLGQPGYGDMALADRIAFAEDIRQNRPSQQVAVNGLPDDLPKPEISERYAQLLDQLRETVAGRPDDLQGHELLVTYEANAGNFLAASEAQRAVLRIKDGAVTVADIGDYGELLVLAAGGYVSPEAEAVLRRVLEEDSEDGRARYYLGLMMVQTGRPDIAFRIWDALLRRGPEDASWIEPILAQIMPVSELAGVRYTLPAIGKGTRPGPSADDIEAASQMTAEERMEMIGGMVEGLSDRLGTEGGPPEDWARLITSLGVLGQRAQALAVFDNAMEVFAGNDGALDMIRAAGSQAGVAE